MLDSELMRPWRRAVKAALGHALPRNPLGDAIFTAAVHLHRLGRLPRWDRPVTYNEHLVRDVGALNLALLVLLAAAAWTLTRELVAVAAMASLVWGAPHLVYHVFSTEGLVASDVALSIGGLAVFVVLPLSVLVFPPASSAPRHGDSAAPAGRT